MKLYRVFLKMCRKTGARGRIFAIAGSEEGLHPLDRPGADAHDVLISEHAVARQGIARVVALRLDDTHVMIVVDADHHGAIKHHARINLRRLIGDQDDRVQESGVLEIAQSNPHEADRRVEGENAGKKAEEKGADRCIHVVPFLQSKMESKNAPYDKSAFLSISVMRESASPSSKRVSPSPQ